MVPRTVGAPFVHGFSCTKGVFEHSRDKKDWRHFMADKRFEITYSQGVVNVVEIWVDKETGVNYLFHSSGEAGGLTPLLDREGKPVVSNTSSKVTL